LGNYESANIECTLWADVEPEDDLNEVMHGLWGMVKENVRSQSLPLLDKKGTQNGKDANLGLPVELIKKSEPVDLADQTAIEDDDPYKAGLTDKTHGDQ